jgi:hypothetical protein
MCTERLPLLDEARRYRPHRKAKKVLHLAGKDDHRDTAGESHRNGVRNEFDHLAELREPE